MYIYKYIYIYIYVLYMYIVYFLADSGFRPGGGARILSKLRNNKFQPRDKIGTKEEQASQK